MQPQTFLQMRADLASMWSSGNHAGNLRRATAENSTARPLNEKESAFNWERSLEVNADVTSMKVRTFILADLVFLALCFGLFSGNRCIPDLK